MHIHTHVRAPLSSKRTSISALAYALSEGSEGVSGILPPDKSTWDLNDNELPLLSASAARSSLSAILQKERMINVISVGAVAEAVSALH